LALAARKKDPDWQAPPLFHSEFRSVAAGHLRTMERSTRIACHPGCRLRLSALRPPFSEGAGCFGPFKPVALFREEPGQFFA